MSGFEFRKSGDVVYHDDKAGAEYLLRLPRIGESRKLDEFTAELIDKRKDLDEQLTEVRNTSRRINALAAIADPTPAEAKELAALEKKQRSLPDGLADVLARFNERIADDTFAWFKRAVELVGEGWPEDPDEWPASVETITLTRQIKEHWATVPLA